MTPPHQLRALAAGALGGLLPMLWRDRREILRAALLILRVAEAANVAETSAPTSNEDHMDTNQSELTTAAGADSQADAAAPTAPKSLMLHPVAAQVIQTIYSSPEVEPKNAATVAASLLQTLAPFIAPAEELAGASAKTQSIVGLSIGAFAAIISLFFPHPKLSNVAN